MSNKGITWQSRRGMARRGSARPGVARQAWYGRSGSGRARLGAVRLGRRGLAGLGTARHGVAVVDGHGLARQVRARPGAAGMVAASETVTPTRARDLPVAPSTVSIWVSEETRRRIVRASIPLLAFIPAATLLMIAVAVAR